MYTPTHRAWRPASLLAAVAGALSILTMGLGAGTADAALPKTCLTGGICFTKSFPAGKTKLTVTGTPGDDTIALAHVRPFSNNTPSGNVSINGKDIHVTDNVSLDIVVNALGGNDHVTLEGLSIGTNPLYGTSVIDGGDGDDVLVGGNRNDSLIGGPGNDQLFGGDRDDRLTGGPGVDLLDAGAGNDQLFARDGERDALHGGLGTDTAQTELPGTDTIDGVETVDAQPVGVVPASGDVGDSAIVEVGRLRLGDRTVTAKAGKTTRLSMSWTHPTSWRLLKMINVTLYRGADAVGNVYVRPHGERLTAHGAIKLVAGTSRLTHRGKTVSMRLAVRLPGSLAGQKLRVGVEAADLDGHRQLVPDAGSISVTK
jgi:RTX calcium-binding nonapeptide repeat (4 copies)